MVSICEERSRRPLFLCQADITGVKSRASFLDFWGAIVLIVVHARAIFDPIFNKAVGGHRGAVERFLSA